MLDSTIIELASRMTRIQFVERTEQLRRDIEIAQNRLTMDGLGRSGALVEAVYDLCARDIELRAQIVWQNVLQVLSQAGIVSSEILADELKQEVLKYAEAIYLDPYNRLQEVVRNVGIGTAQPLTDTRDRALAKVNNAIDLFVVGLQRQEEAKKNQSAAVFNFYSPVGAVQTGASAVAHVVQNLSSQDREALLRALDLVKQSLEAVDNLPGSPKQEIIELVLEARTEADKSKPNGTRLQSILPAIATAIQTVGSLKPAYDTLKAALLPLGMPLP